MSIGELARWISADFLWIFNSNLIVLTVSQLSKPLQTALAGLQQQLEEAVQRKAAATEEKIRAFTAEQCQLLEQFRERAHVEHTVLARFDLSTTQ